MANTSVTIDITKDNVFGEVLKVTGYLGAKDKADASSYTTIATNRKNDEILSRFFSTAASVITDILKPYITSVVYTNGYKVVLSMPSNWNTAIKDDFAHTITNYFVQYVTAQWVRLVKDQDLVANTHEDKWNEDAIGSLSQIKRKLYDRIRPTKPTYTEDTEDSGSSDSEDTDSGTSAPIPSGGGLSGQIGGGNEFSQAQ